MLYVEMGSQLSSMVAGEHGEGWLEVLFRAERVTGTEAARAGVHFGFKTTLVLEDGMRLPLVARPHLVSLIERLDQLCRTRGPRAWDAFEYRLYRDAEGVGYECRFSYPPTVH